MNAITSGLWHPRRKPKGTVSVSFYRAAVISSEGRHFKWRHEDDEHSGTARSMAEAMAAVDALYRRPEPTVVYRASWREMLAIAGIIVAGGLVIWVALALRVGGVW